MRRVMAETNFAYNFGRNVIYLSFYALTAADKQKNLLVDLVRKPFLTDQTHIQKEIQEGEKVF